MCITDWLFGTSGQSTKNMNFLCIIAVILLSVGWPALVGANEDVIRDLVIGNYDDLVSFSPAKRALSQALGLTNLADAFATKIGTIRIPQSINDASGILPVYPKPIAKDTDYVKNCLRSFSPFGKRQTRKDDSTQLLKLANRDIVFIMDTSGSILGSEFLMAKEAISSLVGAFCPLKFGHEVTSSGTKQISMVLLGSGATKVIDFEDSLKGLEHMQEKVLAVKHRRESFTSTARALNFVREAILGQGLSRLHDKSVSTDVIVITDGRCNMDCDSLAEEADAIRAMGHGVNLFAVGVAAARECELDIISGKDPKASFELNGMNSFKEMAEFIVKKARSSPSKCV